MMSVAAPMLGHAIGLPTDGLDLLLSVALVLCGLAPIGHVSQAANYRADILQ